MKALMYEGPQQMVAREVDAPSPAGGEVIIEVAYSGICGSELSGYLGQSSIRKPPLVFGHEFAGRIVALGPGTENIPVGTRVTANPLISCGHCFHCQQGQEQRCTQRRLLGAAVAGSNAALVKVPASSIVQLPDAVSFEQATLAEPIAYAIHVIEMARLNSADIAVVLGMGPIGLFVLQAARMVGCRSVLAVDTNPERLAMAQHLGASAALNPLDANVSQAIMEATAGLGASVVVDAVGSATTRTNAIDLVRRGGTVIFSGLHTEETSLPINNMIRNEVASFGAFAYTHDQFKRAVDAVAAGAIGLEDEWVVKAPLEEGGRWFDKLISNPGGIAKVLLTP